MSIKYINVVIDKKEQIIKPGAPKPNAYTKYVIVTVLMIVLLLICIPVIGNI